MLEGMHLPIKARSSPQDNDSIMIVSAMLSAPYVGFGVLDFHVMGEANLNRGLGPKGANRAKMGLSGQFLLSSCGSMFVRPRWKDLL